MNLTNLIIISVIGTGISSIAVQIITVREFLSQFSGNEITISLVLFCWLMVSGIGSLAAKIFFQKVDYPLFCYCLSNSVFSFDSDNCNKAFQRLHLYSWRISRVVSYFFFILTFSAPYAFLIGFILPYSLSIIKTMDTEFTVGQLYIVDNIGDITGGVY